MALEVAELARSTGGRDEEYAGYAMGEGLAATKWSIVGQAPFN